MREALDKWDKGICIGGRKVSNLRYADDTTLIAGNREDLIELIEKVKSSSEKPGLYLNVKKIGYEVLSLYCQVSIRKYTYFTLF